MSVAADRHQPGRQQKLAGLDAGPVRRHAGNIRRDHLLLARRVVGQRDQVDLDDAADRREGFRRHYRHGARDIRVILVPHIEAIGHVLDIGEIDLRLQ